jgi:hypothetical protein
VLLLILGALSLIGQSAEDDEPESAAPPETTRRADRPSTMREQPAPAPTTVRLTVAPTADVWVCLENGGGDRLIPGTVIGPGPTRTFTAKRFRINLGNGSVRLRVNGKLFQPPQSADPLGYEFTLKGRRTLPDDDRPNCAT